MRYKARRELDGFYTIRGIPVFAEVPKGVKGAPFDIDKEWLQAALAKSRTREREGYLAPLNFEHHGGPERSFKAGQYRLSRVGTLKIGGEKKAVLFADFVKIPPHVFESILGNEWPYRSVEIVSYEDFEIENVALLDDDTPFHKFELLNADSIDVDGKDTPLLDRIPVPMGPVAFAKGGAGGFRALFCFREKDMTKYTIRGNAADGFSIHEDGKPAAAFADAEFGFEPTDAALVSFQDDEKKKDDLPDDEKKLKAMLKRINAKLKKMGAFADDDDKDDEKKGKPFQDENKPAEPDKDKDDKKDLKKSGAVDDKDLVATFARMDRLEKKVETMESAATSSDRLDAALAGLKKDGWHVGANSRKHFAEFAGDEAALSGAVAHYRAVVPKDGPETLDDAETEQQKFYAKFEDPNKAQEFSAQFDQLVRGGMRRDTPAQREAYIKFNMRPARSVG